MTKPASNILILLLLLLASNCDSQDGDDKAPGNPTYQYLSEFAYRASIGNMEIGPGSLPDPVRSPFSGNDVFPLMKYPLDDGRLLTAFLEADFEGNRAILMVEVLEGEVAAFTESTTAFSFGAHLSLHLKGGILSTTLFMGDLAQQIKYKVLDDSLSCISLFRVFE